MAQPEAARKRGSALRFSLRTLLLVVTLAAIGLWGKLQYDEYCKRRLAAQWVEPLLAIPAAPVVMDPWGGPQLAPMPPWPQLRTDKQQEELLVIGATQLADPKQRMAAVKILVETRRHGAQGTLWRILAMSKDSNIQAAAIHLLALERKPEIADRLLPYLDHKEAEVRAAAAESIGFIFQPAFEIPPGNSGSWSRTAFLNTQPPIDIGNLRANETSWTKVQEAPPGIRDRLEAVMLRGASEVERTAAARALVPWPPEKYRFRLAEWGVWIDDGGELKLVQSVLDEIPPFVHQTGNRLDSFAGRLNRIMIITKPIVHLTSGVPLAVDFQVIIRQGRPWFAFPAPDDLAAHATTVYMTRDRETAVKSPLAQLDRADLKPLAVREGYPWIAPGLRDLGSTGGGMGAMENAVTDLGVRWQSLVVSPERRPWMVPVSVPGGERYAWWTRLRAVPTSWLASRDEAERFLYYDGPTLAQSPVEYRLCGQQIAVATRNMFQRWEHFASNYDWSSDPAPQPELRQALVVRAQQGGVQALAFQVSGKPASAFSIELPDTLPLAGDEVESRLLQLLIDAGLTQAEAEGLIDCWRRQFFETHGTRVITVLSRDDYDQMCPLTVRPTPTEIARVGIVLTEL